MVLGLNLQDWITLLREYGELGGNNGAAKGLPQRWPRGLRLQLMRFSHPAGSACRPLA